MPPAVNRRWSRLARGLAVLLLCAAGCGSVSAPAAASRAEAGVPGDGAIDAPDPRDGGLPAGDASASAGIWDSTFWDNAIWN